MSTTALVILHPQFEELEAIAAIDILRRAGINTTVASRTHDLQLTGKNHIPVVADALLAEVATLQFDVVVLPGGPGVQAGFREDVGVREVLNNQAEAGRWIAAICAAPLVLKDAGLLDGKRYVSHPSTFGELPDRAPETSTLVDGRLISSRGAGTAVEFALTVVRELLGVKAAETIAQSICQPTA